MGPVAPRRVGSSGTRARTRVPCIGRWILNHCAAREALFLSFYRALCLPPKVTKVSPHPSTFLELHRFTFLTHRDYKPHGTDIRGWWVTGVLSHLLFPRGHQLAQRHITTPWCTRVCLSVYRATAAEPPMDSPDRGSWEGLGQGLFYSCHGCPGRSQYRTRGEAVGRARWSWFLLKTSCGWSYPRRPLRLLAPQSWASSWEGLWSTRASARF